ncbi:MAG: diaminopimelate epimerase [Deltaproteobacteria bacterium]|jgi:diaminopimelate epimerase|nr:diaminopimelate epimerase [Deltaproteobacteria bacterium]
MNAHGLKYPIPFAKMSGTGNDFIVIDHREPFIAEADQSEFARIVCRRKFSVGADGLILIENSETADFRWQFYNGDGSRAEMCGNGARCAARFAFEKNIAPANMRFETTAGEIEAFVLSETGESVKIRLTSPEDLRLNIPMSIGNVEQKLHFINTGVPHTVVLVNDTGDVPVAEWGREIRFHETFQPAGTNANFAQVVSSDTLMVRTYERGVEGETMACGTGAVASALVVALLEQAVPPLTVITSGGEELTIHFSLTGEKNHRQLDPAKGIYLEGPAHLIYEGQLGIDGVQE